MGTNWPDSRILDTTSNPLMPGSMTSRITTSKAVRFRLQRFERGFAGIHQLHLVTFGFQVEAQPLGEMLLVFHH